MSVLLILASMLLPIVDGLDIDRVHFGLVAVLNLMIGLIAPPVGICLNLVSKIANVSFERILRATLPVIWVLILVLFVITYVALVDDFSAAAVVVLSRILRRIT